jgi:hypothetical protein
MIPLLSPAKMSGLRPYYHDATHQPGEDAKANAPSIFVNHTIQIDISHHIQFQIF